jgi:hypothetical protein
MDKDLKKMIIKPEHRKYVAFFDVLGFESLYQSIGLVEIEKKYNELIEVVNNLNKEAGMRFANVGGRSMLIAMNIPIEYTYFSDTLLFWVDAAKTVNQDPLIDLIEEILCKSIEIELPLRGSLNAEETLFDKKNGIYLGQSLISGARAESAQNWIGVTLSNSFFTSGAIFYTDRVLPYTKHIKSGKEGCVIDFVIDFPRHWRKTRQTDLKGEIRKLDKNPQFSHYYVNTIEFCEFSEKIEGKNWLEMPEYEKLSKKYRKYE